MPVTITELFRGRDAEVTEDYQSSYTRVFIAETDDCHIGAKAVKAALALAIGQPYRIGVSGTDAWFEEDLGAVLKHVGLTCDAVDGRTWTVTAQYGPWTDRPREENPLLEPADVEIGGENYDRPCDWDISGNAVVNSAGDPFDPTVTVDNSRPTMVITRNEPDTAPDLSAAYSDTINNAPFFGNPTGTVKCGVITGRRQWHQACGFYWKRTYPFSLNRNGWQRDVLDQGLRQVISGARKQITIDGQLATSPVPLDGTGGVLAIGGTPQARTFDVYEAKDFSVFGF